MDEAGCDSKRPKSRRELHGIARLFQAHNAGFGCFGRRVQVHGLFRASLTRFHVNSKKNKRYNL